MIVVFIVAGLLLGSAFGSFGALLGAAFGWILGVLQGLTRQVRELEREQDQAHADNRDLLNRLTALEMAKAATVHSGDSVAHEPPARQKTALASPVTEKSRAAQEEPRNLVAASVARPIAEPSVAARAADGVAQTFTEQAVRRAPFPVAKSATTAQGRTAEPEYTLSNGLDNAISAAKGWLLGGNTVVRVGIIVLLVGVILLLKFAADNAMFPLEARLISTAVLGVALVGLGLRLRGGRPGFAITLQGGGVAVNYLVVYFSYQVYGLLPPVVAFGLLVVIAAASIGLALYQDAQVLLLIGQVFGFLAPIVAATTPGNHVALFSYYLLLNTVIFIIALRRAYRPLNLVGFIFTFAVGAAWAEQHYLPEHFLTVELFLITFFVLYVAIAVLFALAHRIRGWVDSALVFGTPIAFLGLQAFLVEDIPYAMAATTLAMAGLYFGLSYFIQQRKPPELAALADAFFAIAVGCVTLAVPYVFTNAGLTGAGWALEGAAAYWIAVRQKHTLGRVAGVLLQLLAAVAVLASFSETPTPTDMAVLNSRMLGALFTAVGGLFVAWYSGRRQGMLGHDAAATLQWLVPLVVGLVTGAALLEVEAHLSAEHQPAGVVFVLGLVALSMAMVGRVLRWRTALYPAFVLQLLWIPAMLLWHIEVDQPLLAGGGAVAWPIWFLALFACLRWFTPDEEPGPESDSGLKESQFTVPRLIALGYWGVTAWVAVLWLGVFPRWLNLSQDWALSAVLLTVAVALWGLVRGATSARGPFRTRPSFYLGSVAAPLGLFCAMGVVVLTSSAGDVSPLPYLPVLNPLDASQLVALWVFYRWGRQRAAQFSQTHVDYLSVVRFAAAALTFLWFNAVLARSVHHFVAVPFNPSDLYASVLLQVSVSISWTLIGLACTVWGSRKSLRPLWFVGGALLGIVVVKLFAIDLEALSTIAKIATFIVVGVLLMAVGFFAPVPPPRSDEAAGEAP